MHYTQLGRSGLKVSRLALGTMNFGDATEEAAAYEIMDMAMEAGINFFDTADVYGGPQRPDMAKGYGLSEEIIGRWLAQGARRDKIVLATKLYQPMDYGPNDRYLSAYHIRRACEASLRRLKTDHIDIYQMHHIDRLTPWEEIWQAMEVLIWQGKISYIGSSNFAAWQLATAQGAAAARHMLGLVSEQSLYNLNARMVELEVLPACRYHGLGVLPWSPLGGGLLGGVLAKSVGKRRAAQADRIAKYRPQIEAYEALCREMDEQPANIALAWLLHNPAVTAPILGVRTKAQLLETLRAPDIALPAEILAKLDTIWPGPGGEAPEAYAW
ncbi:aldo/keto reductase [Candidatus Tokpelaia sp.]|uniref:aldo/keto reductase n=1 Tax=Candidatus Tokpelaia sp. TaxID=2233777 RepID=UPI0012388F33|nr:aldo/keto reductase [Candidatus Tokpelaia sp.]KAA6406016.1 aldo/keto reductase [Candidatus Tokpelaia sp.]